MPSQTVLYYSSILITSILGFILGIIAFSYFLFLKKFFHLREQETIQNTALNKKLWEEANAKTTKIIEEATLKGQEIIKGSQIFSNKIEENLKQEMQDALNRHAQISTEVIEETKKNISIIVESVSQEIKKGVNIEISEFDNLLKKDFADFQNAFDLRLKQELEKADLEAASYKKNLIAKLDKSILTIVREVTYDSLGRSISLEEHKDLVIKALEEAKKENVF